MRLTRGRSDQVERAASSTSSRPRITSTTFCKLPVEPVGVVVPLVVDATDDVDVDVAVVLRLLVLCVVDVVECVDEVVL